MQLSAFSHLRHRAPTTFAIHKKRVLHHIKETIVSLVALDVDDDQMHPPVLNSELSGGKIILY